MFVLLGPNFDGTRDAYQRLARATGLVSYDLKARIRPGFWGVVKLLGDAREAEALAESLRELGFAPVLIERERSEEHTSELQSQSNLVCRLLLEKKKTKKVKQ